MRLLLTTFALLLCGAASGADVQRIVHPQAGYSGVALVEFPAGTTLRVDGLPYVVIIDTYEGEWDEGLANGQGILKGRLQQLPIASSAPGDLAAESLARTLDDRARVEATFLAGHPSASTLGPVVPPDIAVVYRGAFEDGMASGAGEVEAPHRRLRGQFLRWLPEGFVIHFADHLPVLGETFSRGMPADGIVFINQYPAGLATPSRTFIGTSNGGKISGEWFEVAWSTKGDDYERYVIGDRARVVYADGRRSDCSYDTAYFQQPATTELAAIRGDAETRAPAVSDPLYLRSPVRCTYMELDGWSYSFGLTGNGPFDQKHIPPYSCTDPEGRSGTMTIGEDDIILCAVTYVTTKKHWTRKVVRAIEEAARDTRDALLNPLNKAGEKTVEHVCAVAQKKPGENCHFNGSYSVTFDIPDTKAMTDRRASEDLNRFLAARAKLLDDSRPEEPFWRSATLALDACAQSCTGPAQAYSRLTITQMEQILASGFSDDIKHRQVASLGERSWDMLEKFLPGVEAIAGSYSAIRLTDQLLDAKLYSWSLMDGKTGDEWLRARIFNDYVMRLTLKHGTRSLLTVTSENLSVLSEEFLLHPIPGLTLVQQATLINAFGVKQLGFFSTYQEIASARDLVRGLIDAKLKELRLPPPPAGQ